MRILLFLLIPFILLGQTYIYNVPCTNNAANTTVTNNGSAAVWVSSVNTNTIYSSTNSGSFLLDANGDYIYSGENITATEFYIQYQKQLLNANGADTEVHLQVNSNGGFAVNDANEIQIYRIAASDEFYIRYKNSAGTQYYKSTTDVTGDNTINHTYLWYFKTSILPPTFDLWIDGIKKTWGAWNLTPTGTITMNSGKVYYGEFGGTLEPDVYIQNIKMWAPGSKQFGFPHFKKFSNFLENGITSIISTGGSTNYQFPYTFPLQF